MKQRIILTEGDLHRIIRKCTNEVILNEKKERQYRNHDYPNQEGYEDLKKIINKLAHNLYADNYYYDAWDQSGVSHYLVGRTKSFDGQKYSHAFESNVGDYAQSIGLMLKNYGFSKSYKRYLQAVKYIDSASKLLEAINQDVASMYSDNKYKGPYYPDDNQMIDMSGWSTYDEYQPTKYTSKMTME